MYTTTPSTTRRIATTISSLALAALVFVALAGPGRAAPEAAPDTGCTSVCIDAGGTFGPTVPVALDQASADQFAAIIGGASADEKSITMDFMSVDEGAEVVVLDAGARVATVQLDSGRIGYVPVAWLQSA